MGLTEVVGTREPSPTVTAPTSTAPSDRARRSRCGAPDHRGGRTLRAGVAFRKRRQPVEFLVRAIIVGAKHEDDGIEVRITYRAGPPPPPPAEAGGGELSV